MTTREFSDCIWLSASEWASLQGLSPLSAGHLSPHTSSQLLHSGPPLPMLELITNHWLHQRQLAFSLPWRHFHTSYHESGLWMFLNERHSILYVRASYILWDTQIDKQWLTDLLVEWQNKSQPLCSVFTITRLYHQTPVAVCGLTTHSWTPSSDSDLRRGMRNNWLMTYGEETTKAHGGVMMMVNRFMYQDLDNNQKICQLSFD